MKNSDRSIMLAAGGTGGHLFPAFALSEELGRRGHAVDLVTDMRGDRYGTGFPARNVYQVPSATLTGKSPAAITKTVTSVVRGIRAAWTLLKRVRPTVVVGFGGYPTLPPLVAARMLSIPTVVHEQNAVLGRANRMLAKRVTAVATSFEHTRLLDEALASKVSFTGNPVRDAVIAEAAKPYSPRAEDGRFQILIFGGSQGARYFSDAVPPSLVNLPQNLRSRLRIVQQVREEDMAHVVHAYRAAGITAEVAAFFKNLPVIMAQSQLVIARAGASSVAELTVIGRPSILVPLPHSLDNDQLHNATRLAEAGGGWCIEQKDLSAERLTGEIARLMCDPAELARAATAAKAIGRPDAVTILADLVEDIAGLKSPART